MPNEDTVLGPFECHGIALATGKGDHAIGDCPFCGKPSHLYINVHTGVWDCKRCGENGNVVTFLTKYAEKAFAETSDRDLERLSRFRGNLPIKAFKDWNVGWDGRYWLLPAYSESGMVRDIVMWDGSMLRATTGCKRQLFGMYGLAQAPKGSTVWVCEGEWDTIALHWLLGQAKRDADVAVGVPGASIFKEAWREYFKDMNVHIVLDNDKSGDDGSLKAGRMLEPFANSVRYVHWPESRPVGYDIRDFVNEGRGKRISAEDGIALLIGLLKSYHRRAPKSNVVAVRREDPASFQDVLNTFEKWIEVEPDFESALAICLATCLSTALPGDPIWFYIVGPPGSGKTVILMSLKDSPSVSFHSTLTARSLVSGFKNTDDPSLIPQINNKTAVFKDGTELLSLAMDARREAYSVLRGAYDGHIRRTFGNGVVREYTPHFNMLIGITPAVHGDNQASMGERFLKFEMREMTATVDSKIRTAISNITKELRMENDLAGICRRFLAQKVDVENLPTLPEEAVDKIVNYAQILAQLRAQVEREAFGNREIKYRPVYESGTRIAKQLAKLAQMLMIVFAVKEPSDVIYDLLQRVVFDTSIGYHLDIVKVLAKVGDAGISMREIVIEAEIPQSAVFTKVSDLEHLGVIQKIPGVRPALNNVVPAHYVLAKRFRRLWKESVEERNPGESNGQSSHHS